VPAITLGVFVLAAGCAICGLRPSLAVVAIGAAIALAAVPLVNSAASTMRHERVPAALQGRVFALRGGVSRSLDPIGAVVAGVAISVLAEPAMSPGGALDRTFGRVLATGDGRGAAIVMIFVGLALAMIAAAVRSSASLRHLDAPRPAGTDRQADPEQSEPVAAVGSAG
jgi:MFS family permease